MRISAAGIFAQTKNQQTSIRATIYQIGHLHEAIETTPAPRANGGIFFLQARLAGHEISAYFVHEGQIISRRVSGMQPTNGAGEGGRLEEGQTSFFQGIDLRRSTASHMGRSELRGIGTFEVCHIDTAGSDERGRSEEYIRERISLLSAEMEGNEMQAVAGPIRYNRAFGISGATQQQHHLLSTHTQVDLGQRTSRSK